MTNREWLASLTDEQLIKAIRSFKEDTCCMCKEDFEVGKECGFCFDGQVAWLSMEHVDDDWEERDYWYCT